MHAQTQTDAQHDQAAATLQHSSALASIFWLAADEARFDQHTIAAVTGYSKSWLEKARWSGGGPAFIRLGGTESTDKRGKTRVFGGRVFYRKVDVAAWLAAHKALKNTSEHRQQIAA